MKIASKIIALLLPVTALLVLPIKAAQSQNLLANGTFEGSWTGSFAPEGWTLAGNGAQRKAPGLDGSSASLLLSDGRRAEQSVASRPEDWTLSFQFTLNTGTATTTERIQPFVIYLFEAGDDTGSNNNAWINLRFDTRNAANGSEFQIYDKDNASLWVSAGVPNFTGSTYDPAGNTFTGKTEYQFSITYDSKKDTYSISYGIVGATLSTINTGTFRHATTGAGLGTIRFASGGSGFALDNVVLTTPIPEPATAAAVILAAAFVATLVWRGRRQQ
ncbi:anchor protein [Opitutaceae bacterium TAV5]|nr:anchor protein [Opitutaceae bacterium TAV5]